MTPDDRRFLLMAIPAAVVTCVVVWLALVWSLQEWLKSSVPFGGFPWGVAAYSQTNGPFVALAQWGGSPLLSFAVALVATSVCALAIDIANWMSRGNEDRLGRHSPPSAAAACNWCQA